MRRTNLYLTEKQIERLQARAQKEGLAVAELVRRAVDAFLAWDDPTYHPSLPNPPQTRNAHSSRLKRAGLSGPFTVNLGPGIDQQKWLKDVKLMADAS